MQFVAINWHVYLLTKDPLALGLVGLFRGVPIIVCSLAGGVVADAFDRKRTMIVTQAVMLLTAALLTAETLGDIYGRRRIFLLGITLFTAGTIVCALAPNAVVLIAGRAISGLGAAFALPMSLVLLTLAYPRREERAHAMGIWASCNGLAFIIGPTFGGWLVDSVGWRSIFYMSLPACAAALFLTLYAIEESTEPEGRRLDLPGQVRRDTVGRKHRVHGQGPAPGRPSEVKQKMALAAADLEDRLALQVVLSDQALHQLGLELVEAG